MATGSRLFLSDYEASGDEPVNPVERKVDYILCTCMGVRQYLSFVN